MKTVVYTDASFDDKHNIAGIGIFIQKGYKERTFSLNTIAFSVNQAELYAIYIAGILTHGKALIYTDSQTAIAYINKTIKDKPRTREQYIRHKYCELLAYRIRLLNLTVQKVKAHQKDSQDKTIGNNIADLLARRGRNKCH